MTKKFERAKINSSAAASVWYTATNFISRGMNVIFTPIFTRTLTPEEFGLYPLFTGFLSIFTVVTTLEMSGSVMYRGLAKFDGPKRDVFLSSALGAQITLSTISVILYIIFKGAINATTTLTTPLVLILFLQVFIDSAIGFYFARKRYEGDYKSVSVINVINGIMTPIIALLFIKLGLGGKSRIIAPLMVSGLISIPIILRILKRGKKLFLPSGWKFLFGFTLPMLPHYLSLSVIAQSEKIIIAKSIGESALGKYSAAYSTGLVLSIVTSGITLAMSPWIIRILKTGNFVSVSRAISASVRLVCLLTLIFLCATPEFFAVIAAKDYYEALPVSYIIAVSSFFSFVSSMLTNCLLHYGKPYLITKNSVVTALFCVSAGIVSVKLFGYIGGAWAPLISHFLLYSLNAKTVRKLSNKELFGTSEGLKAALLFAVFAPLLFFLRFSVVARIFVFAALILLLLPEISKCKKIVFA